MAGLEDIVAMKLDAITDRVTKKDYFDIAELLNTFTLQQMLGFYSEKYPKNNIRLVIDAFTDFNRNTVDLEKMIDPISLALRLS